MDNFWKTIDTILNCIISSLDKFREYLNSGSNSKSKKLYASIIAWIIGLILLLGFKSAVNFILFFVGVFISATILDILRTLKVFDKICLWWKGLKQHRIKEDK